MGIQRKSVCVCNSESELKSGSWYSYCADMLLVNSCSGDRELMFTESSRSMLQDLSASFLHFYSTMKANAAL